MRKLSGKSRKSSIKSTAAGAVQRKGKIERKRKKEPKWMITNTILGTTVILLCAFLYLYEHHFTGTGDMTETSAKIADEELAKGVNTFTFRTSREIFNNQEKNVIYSPVSLYYTLLLAACGADGETADQLNHWLGMDEACDAAEWADRLYQQLDLDGEIGKLKLSASIWNDSKLKLKKDFKKTAKDYCHASVHAVDFKSGALSGKLEAWVEKQTDGTVTPRPKSGPDSDDVLYLLNTIYFYDEWREQFNRSVTKTDTFFPAGGGTVQSEFMFKEYSVHGFSKGEGFTRSFLSLKESGTMYFVLPDPGVSLDSFFESEERLKEVLEGGERRPGQVNFKIPKFSIDTSLDGKRMMEQAGLQEIFTWDSDFSNMSDDDIYLSSLVQDSHISINEDGVEAAAFTEAALMEAAAMDEERAEMILDRPFLFGIQYGDYWLFIGICSNPAE